MSAHWNKKAFIAFLSAGEAFSAFQFLLLFPKTPVACGWIMQIPAKGKKGASNKEGTGERVHAEVNYLQIGSYTSTSDT